MPHLLSVAVPLLIYSMSCIGMGALIMQLCTHRPRDAAIAEIVLCFLLGQGCLGSLLHIPALAGVFTVPIILLMTFPLACWGLLHLFMVSGAVRKGFGHLFREFRHTPLLWQITTVVVTFVLLAGGCSVASEITDDARAFYMVLPKVLAASHRLVLLPLYEDFTAVGLLAEVQLAALYVLGMPGGSPRIFSWITALAGSVVLLAIGRRAGLGRRGLIISLSMLTTSSAVALLLGSGKTDFYAAAFGLCAYYYAFRSWDKDTRKVAVILAGLFSGFAIVAKLSYLVPLLPSVCVLLLWREISDFTQVVRSRERFLVLLRQCAKVVLIFGAVATIAFVPQLTKNWLLYGDALKTLNGSFQWFSPETTRRIVLTYPFVLTYGSYWGQFGTMSPLLLAFLPLALFSPLPSLPWFGPVAALSVATSAGLGAWVILFPAVPMPRAFLATLILLIVPASWAAERFCLTGRMSAHVVWAATLATLLLFYRVWGGEIFLLRDAYHNFVSEQPEGAPRGDEVNSSVVYRALNEIAEPGARVYTLTYFKFLMRSDLIQCATRSNERPNSSESTNPEEFWHRMYTHGFTYILAEDAYNEINVDWILTTKPAWVNIEPIAKKGGWGAYRIVFDRQFEKVSLTTRELAPGAWVVQPVL